MINHIIYILDMARKKDDLHIFVDSDNLRLSNEDVNELDKELRELINKYNKKLKRSLK
jgi:hypothetical protein